MTNKPALQKILKGILHTEDANKHNQDRMEILNLKTVDKYSENSIELAAHIQILKKPKQLYGRNHHILLKINIKCY
jgi:hypothetical protein